MSWSAIASLVPAATCPRPAIRRCNDGPHLERSDVDSSRRRSGYSSGAAARSNFAHIRVPKVVFEHNA